MKRQYLIAIAAILVVAGCATEKTLEATGGSRADGTVNLAYEYGLFEVPKINTEQALITARQRCHAWGYSDAEPFGGRKTECEQPSNSGCLRFLVTVTYQCTGGSH
jgi:hypothetical protein